MTFSHNLGLVVSVFWTSLFTYNTYAWGAYDMYLISCHWLWYDITTADAPVYECVGNSGTSTFRAQVLLKLVKTCSSRLIFLTNKFQQCCVISILLRCEGSHRPRKCQIKVPEDKNSNQANLRLRPFWIQCLWY